MPLNLEKIKKLNLPNRPGCYQYFNIKNELLYIGKASNLKNRVSSYWSARTQHSPAKFSMLKQIEKIKILETETEIEALLLEANLIKKYQPPYNIVMRDDKRHAWLKISTEEKWPRLFFTRRLDQAGRYFGPFPSLQTVKEVLKIVRHIWPYRSCYTLPKKPCLYFSLNKCPGPCADLINQKDYQKIIKEIILFLEGKKQKIIQEYELKIKSLERKKEEEKNKELVFLKYKLLQLKNFLKQANPISLSDKYAADVDELAKILGLAKTPERIEGYDIANLFGGSAVGSMVVFKDGVPDKSEYRKFKIKKNDGKANDIKMLKEVLERRLKRSLIEKEDEKEKWDLPDLILIDGGKAQLNIALSILKKFKINITVISISKGDGLRSAGAPDKIFFPNQDKPLKLSLNSSALHILKRVRDEAHRFAVEYHRKIRRKKFLNL